jgi:LPXTG-site transpeptidase (sortase) family protein
MQSPHSPRDIYTLVKLRKVPFLVIFFVTVFLSYAVLYAIDFYPEPKTEEAVTEEAAQLEEETVEVEPTVAATQPTKIIFESLDREVVVLNPESREIADLDAALLEGVVRHPDSANFAEKGNIFILGHSSYLPNVMNKNFQAFNGIQKLVWGDLIKLQSEDTEYTYRVQKAYQAKASDVTVPMTPGKAMLTLATCNSFGAKDDRFMVEAVLIDEKPL